jgi:hypothetical protein
MQQIANQRLTTQAYKAVIVAAIDKTLFTSPTRPIVYGRLDTDPCSDLDIVYVLANLLNGAGEFMP